jgi:hypothetical protein
VADGFEFIQSFQLGGNQGNGGIEQGMVFIAQMMDLEFYGELKPRHLVQ